MNRYRHQRIKLDKENPNKNLRNQTIKGLIIIKDLKFEDDGKWSTKRVQQEKNELRSIIR